MPLLLNSVYGLTAQKDFETGLLLSQGLCFMAYKTYITVIFTYLVLKLSKTKIYYVHLRLLLILQTRVSYTVSAAHHSHQRGIFGMLLK